jgi:predicted peptidase
MTTAVWALLAWEFAAMPSEETVRAYPALSYTFSGGEYRDEAFRYRLLSPENMEAGKVYPLVLFLHGAGERGDDNVGQLAYLPEWMAEAENRKKYPCFVLAPQCRAKRFWVNVNWGDEKSTPWGEPSEQMQVVEGILEHVLKTHPVDRQRVYLTGLSMGGYGSWDLAIRRPELFAAVAPICGGGDETQVGRIVKLPIWAWHGDADAAVPVERTRRMIQALEAAGGTPKYTELKGVGHDSWTPAYTDPQGLLPWMFAQRRAAAASDPSVEKGQR